MDLNIPKISESGVEITTSGDTVFFYGSIDCPAPGAFLNPFFKELNKKIINHGIKNVKIDSKDLKFLNSSGIKEFVDWVMDLSTLSEEQQYFVEVITNPDQIWQESSISTLVYLNQKLIKKTVSK